MANIDHVRLRVSVFKDFSRSMFVAIDIFGEPLIVQIDSLAWQTGDPISSDLSTDYIEYRLHACLRETTDNGLLTQVFAGRILSALQCPGVICS
jgi:hypothetical protein